MPIVDMPLERLKEYAGTNPKPDDFEVFWDKSLDEMRRTDPCVELVPAKFRAPYAECFHLFFTGVGGARVHAKYLRPRNSSAPHPGLLMFHGYSCHAGDWSDKLSYVAAGFSVMALDCRGQGGLSEDKGGVKGNTLRGHIIRGMADENPEKLYFRNVFLDTAQLAGIMMALDDIDPGKVAAIGGSQGGGLTFACAALEPRLNRAVALYPFLCDYKRVWDMDLALNAYAELRDYCRLFDPLHEHEDDFFRRLGYIDVQHLAPRIRSRIIMATGLMDNICPPSTQFAAYNKITSEKELAIYPDYGHEGLPGMADRAFAWLASMHTP